MLKITHGQRCSTGRRELLRLGGIGAMQATFGGGFNASAAPVSDRRTFGAAKRCVLLFLTGGPAQHDTWDPKPEAPLEIRGELKPIQTAAAGIHISELFPRLARHADRYCIVRSATHGDGTHTTAGYTMLTGADHPQPGSLEGPKPSDHPHFGSILAAIDGSDRSIPNFVTTPEVVKDAAVNEIPGQRAGFLGPQYDPLLVEQNLERTGFRPPAFVTPPEISVSRLMERRRLLQRLDAADPEHQLNSLANYYQQAFDLIRSSTTQQAFDLTREPAAAQESYGEHIFGRGCLLARRLLEAGVRFTAVYWPYDGPDDSPVWDTHWNNFRHLRERLMPPADRAISALLADLQERGLLSETLVICMGEFGRSPRINGQAGRDHWPNVFSLMLAGAGIPGGAVYGASDADGAFPAARPVSPRNLAATVLHLLGVPPDLEIHDRLNRPFPVTRGEVLADLFA